MQDMEGDEPAHHARRPMNAFLIFCKRHRSVVRDKYPNLENRSITKILGEWWANLDNDEKSCYTGLAKQYKDAFFNAHPDFKWYKLPAPPLRTLSSRPRETPEKHPEPPTDPHEELEKTNNNSTKVDFNKKPEVYEIDPKPLLFTPGKLADEAQMGGLSSLLATKTEISTPNPYYSPPSFTYTPISSDRTNSNVERAKPKGREDTIRELQNALSETTRVFEEEFDEEKNVYTVPYRNNPNNQFTNQDMIDQIVDKRYSHEEYGYQKNWDDDEKGRSGRSCKGKRYQEFMAVGGLIVNKRQKRGDYDKMSEDYNATCSWDSGNSRSEDFTVADDLKNDTYLENNAADTTDMVDGPEPDNNAHKAFKAADFDLDAKIKALPSLSLEKFQQKKRENKRKKKTANLKPKALESSHIVNSVPRHFYDDRREMVESWRETVIGSQKRKPRKISITRLEINSMVSSADYGRAYKHSPEIKIATEAPATIHTMDMCKSPSSVDLLALATLAEVAANTSKLEDTAILEKFAAKASDGNASKV